MFSKIFFPEHLWKFFAINCIEFSNLRTHVSKKLLWLHLQGPKSNKWQIKQNLKIY